MTVRPQRLAIDEGMGQGREQLRPIGAHQFGAHCRGGNLDQYHVIEADAIEGVFQGQYPWISCAMTMASSTVRMVSGDSPLATRFCERWSATARMPPRLSEGWAHSAASQVSL